MRGASGASGSSPMCSSTTSDASQSRVDVHTGVATEAGERLDERLPGDPVQRQRERIDGGRDEIGADPRRDERVGERRARRGLDVEADGQPARLAEALDELLRDVREQRPGRIVEEHARSAELAEPPAPARRARPTSPVRPGL